MGLPRTFRDPSGLFSYTVGVNGLTADHHLYSFRDFIVAQLKRVKKRARFKKGQRWVHRVQFRQAIYYCYPLDSDDDPLIFPQNNTAASDFNAVLGRISPFVSAIQIVSRSLLRTITMKSG